MKYVFTLLLAITTLNITSSGVYYIPNIPKVQSSFTYNNLLGIPYSYGHTDCSQLVIDYLNKILNYNYPDNTAKSLTDQLDSTSIISLNTICLFKTDSTPYHIGIVIKDTDKLKLLHTTKTLGSHLTDLDSPEGLYWFKQNVKLFNPKSTE